MAFFGVLSFIFVLIIIGAIVYLTFYIRNRIKNDELLISKNFTTSEEQALLLQTDLQDSMNTIENTYATNASLNSASNAINDAITQVAASNVAANNNIQNDYNTKFGATKTSMSTMQDDYNSKFGTTKTSMNVMQEDYNSKFAQNAATINGLSNSFTTNALNIGSYLFKNDTNSNLFITGPKQLSINSFGFSNATGNSLNISGYTVQGDLNSNLNISGPNQVNTNTFGFSNAYGQTLNMNKTGTLNFAASSTPYTLDVGNTNNFRVKMSLDPNAEIGLYNDSYVKAHAFDQQGNAMHSGNVSLNNSNCIQLGMGVANKPTDAGQICYQKESSALDIFGATATGDSTKNVKIWDNLSVTNGVTSENMTASNLVLGGLSLMTVNEEINVMNSGGVRLGTLAITK